MRAKADSLVVSQKVPRRRDKTKLAVQVHKRVVRFFVHLAVFLTDGRLLLRVVVLGFAVLPLSFYTQSDKEGRGLCGGPVFFMSAGGKA